MSTLDPAAPAASHVEWTIDDRHVGVIFDEETAPAFHAHGDGPVYVTHVSLHYRRGSGGWYPVSAAVAGKEPGGTKRDKVINFIDVWDPAWRPTDVAAWLQALAAEHLPANAPEERP